MKTGRYFFKLIIFWIIEEIVQKKKTKKKYKIVYLEENYNLSKDNKLQII